jgi:hypothetical protein
MRHNGLCSKCKEHRWAVRILITWICFSKPLGLRRSLGQVHEGGHDQRGAEQNDKTTGQRAALSIQGIQSDRMAGE